MLDVEIQIGSKWPRGLKKPIQEVAEAAFAAAARSKLKTAPGCCIRLAEDKEVKELNHDFRGKAKPTNVLSFPAMEWNEGKLLQSNPENWLGDIILARSVVEKEAKAQKKTLKQHVLHLVAHGTVHLLGYDHMEDKQAMRMERLEAKILKPFGIENPYE